MTMMMMIAVEVVVEVYVEVHLVPAENDDDDHYGVVHDNYCCCYCHSGCYDDDDGRVVHNVGTMMVMVVVHDANGDVDVDDDYHCDGVYH